MWQDVLRAIGRGLAAVATALFLPPLQATGDALGAFVRRLAPFVVLGIIFLILWHTNPQLLNTLLEFGIAVAVIIVAFWAIGRGHRRR